jgi:hypothetical protein
MVALICDICGGKLSMGAGGIAVCESCGMEHSKDRIREKIQEDKAMVIIDNSHMIDNYLTMAENAYESSNYSEAETYCNKVIEIESQNSKSWFIKGKAAGWMSTLGKIRFSESALCFSNAIEYAKDEEKEDISHKSSEEIKKLALALIELRGVEFIKSPEQEEADGFSSDISTILTAVTQLNKKTGMITSGFMEPIAERINTTVVAAWSHTIQPDYLGSENHPNKYDFDKFIERIGYCTMLVEKAIGLSDEDDKEDLKRYENLIFLHEQAINCCSWNYRITDWGKSWYKDYSLTKEAVEIRRTFITQFNLKIAETGSRIVAESERKEKEEEERKAALKSEFWLKHTSENEKFSSEISRLDILLKESYEIGSNEEFEFIKTRLEALGKIIDEDRSADDVLSQEELKYIDNMNEWSVEQQKKHQEFVVIRENRIARCNELNKELIYQEEIIAQNKQLFGDGAKIRKSAKERINAINCELKQYGNMK